ncbi:MAG: transketolase, partial [Clostridiales bacterium]|nr:transketolase [Clostridiales bacterium]
KPYRVFVLCGDGELDEGQNWEGMMSASKWNLENLIIIIDRNHVQLDGTEGQIMPLGNVRDKLEAFGFQVQECDGHDIEKLSESIQSAIDYQGPAAIIADTIKGKGVSFMEGQAAWHGQLIGQTDYEQAIRELKEGLL